MKPNKDIITAALKLPRNKSFLKTTHWKTKESSGAYNAKLQVLNEIEIYFCFSVTT